MAMVISGGKSDLGNYKLPFKLPFLDLYLVKGVKIRRLQESKKTQAKNMEKMLRENIFLRRRLARYEG